MKGFTAERASIAAACTGLAGLGLAWISRAASILPPPGAPVLGDARVPALMHLAADLALWAALLRLVRRAMPPAGLFAFAVVALALAALSPIAPRPVGIPLLARPPLAAAPDSGWELLGWPFGHALGALLVWLPAAALAVSPKRTGHRPLLAACAAAAILVASVCAQPGPLPPPFATELLFGALLLNGACAAALAGLAPATSYAVLVGIALLDPAPERLPRWFGPGVDAAAPANVHSGSYTGPLVHAQGVLLQVRLQGSLRPPDSQLYLLTAGGRRVDPFQRSAAAAPPAWRRLNFPVPSEPFALIARVAPGTTLRFTDPQPVARSAWLAGKVIATWPVWIVLAGLFAALAAANLSVALPRAPWLPWLALLAYAVFLSRHIDATAGPNDSGGYLNSAKLIAHGAVTAAPRLPLPAAALAAWPADPGAFAATTFVPTPDGRLAPEYPVGFPLLVAAAAQVLPWRVAVPAVILLHLLAGVWLTYLLGRAVSLPPAWAGAGAAIIALNAVYLFQGLQPQSDGPALVWVTLAFLCALRERPAAAGLAAAVAVLIRPSNSLSLLPLALCFARPGGGRPLLRFIAGGLPGAAFLLWYNHRLFGHVLTTGYGDPAQVSAGFGLRFVPLTLRSYARWLPYYFTPVVLLAPIAPFLRAIPGRTRLILAVWAGTFVCFYAAYWCTYDNWYNLRFLLPAAPALVLLGLWTTRAAARRWAVPPIATAAAAAAMLTVAVAGAFQERVTYWMRANQVHAAGARWAAGHLPPDAVVFAKAATGPLMYYSDLAFVRMDSAPARSDDFFAALRRAGRPVYAVTYHWEQPNFQWGHGNGTGYPPLPGRWIRRAVLGERQIFVWERAP